MERMSFWCYWKNRFQDWFKERFQTFRVPVTQIHVRDMTLKQHYVGQFATALLTTSPRMHNSEISARAIKLADEVLNALDTLEKEETLS